MSASERMNEKKVCKNKKKSHFTWLVALLRTKKTERGSPVHRSFISFNVKAKTAYVTIYYYFQQWISLGAHKK